MAVFGVSSGGEESITESIRPVCVWDLSDTSRWYARLSLVLAPAFAGDTDLWCFWRVSHELAVGCFMALAGGTV